jgi:hypothetical protein
MTGKQEIMKLGHIKGLQECGGKLLKEDEKYLYFDIPKGIDNDALKAINSTLYEYTGLKLKVRRLL